MDFRKILADTSVDFSPRKSEIGSGSNFYVESHSAVVVCVSVSAALEIV